MQLSRLSHKADNCINYIFTTKPSRAMELWIVKTPRIASRMTESLRKHGRNSIINFLAGHGTDMDVLTRDVMERRGGGIEEMEKALLTIRGMKQPTPQDILVNFIDGSVLFGRVDELYWEAPPIRAIITKDTYKIPEHLQPHTANMDLIIREDVDFDSILTPCRIEDGTWITDKLAELYHSLASQGWVFTMGAFQGDKLVAGLWGVEIGGCLGLMSLFHTEPGTGSICFGKLLASMHKDSRISVVDCGYLTEHFKRYGANGVTRDEFRNMLVSRLHRKHRHSRKQFDEITPNAQQLHQATEASI